MYERMLSVHVFVPFIDGRLIQIQIWFVRLLLYSLDLEDALRLI